MKRIYFYVLLFFFSLNLLSQNTNRIFSDFKEGESNFKIAVNDGYYRITFYNPFIVETTFIPNNQSIIDTSHAVVLTPSKVKISVIEKDATISLKSSGIEVEITKKPFQISYLYNGKLLTSEKKGYFKSKHEPLDFVKGNFPYSSSEKISFNLEKEEILYGTGARAVGMNRRGKRLPLYNRAHYGYGTYSELMNYTLPIVISSKKYLLHFDNAPIGYLDLDSKNNNTLTYETISGRKTYQVIVGNSWQKLIENYTSLTGKQPLPPRWILGNFASRFGYHSQKETEYTIQKFKEDDIPVDAVILDLYWFGKDVKGTMGNFEVYKDSFPQMKDMVSNFNKKGIKTVFITEPFVLTTSSKWKEADKNQILAKDSLGNSAKYDFYFGNTGIIDIYKDSGRKWFWNIYKEILDLGVKGLWGDLGEPEVLPSWVQFSNAKADEIHNIYGHNWAKLIFDGYQKDYPNERPFILMRAGYSGSQRYGMIPWSGDVSRSWEGLQSQPEIALQMGMQGLAYMHSDLGGFAGANLDDNLYVRWLQYGVFQPIYRPHAQEDVPSEPVFRNKKTKQLAKEAIELRYKMLPYNYNLAFNNNQKGTPLMRPLFFEEDKEELLENASNYLWGNDFLVAPILKDSVLSKEVYFPSTSNWYDFYTGAKHIGGNTKTIPVKESYIPTFIRGNALLLFAKPMQNTQEYNAKNLELHYFFDSKKDTETFYYNDDGLTANAFEKEQYEILEFEVEYSNTTMEIDFEAETGKNWQTSDKQIDLVIHNIDWVPKKVKVNGKKINYSIKNNQLKLSTNWNTKRELKIKIPLK